jgi:NADPH-dependent glutamate synthase beta subunit-like oxidoreductase
MLKRFVVDNTREYRLERRRKITPSRKEKIAVIGSGPAGMTAAHDLVLKGYRVTVFEQEATLGGMLAHAVPRYRLPPEALREDLDDILALGVEVKAPCKVGTDISFQELRESHDAVVVAIGLSQSNLLPIPGGDSEGVLPGIAFLWDVANGRPPALGERVLVVGGGNVAVDAARTARRLGVAQVTMVCLVSRDEMPAWPWEIEEAEEEGILILNSWGP